MGLSAVAGHLVMLIAIASAGTLLASAVIGTLTDGAEAQHEAIGRLDRAADERLTLASDGYQTGQDRVIANWTNDGGNEVPIDEVTLLVQGVVTDPDTVERFQVQEDPTSNLWMPGETLEVWVNGQGDLDVTIVGPLGSKSHRRA